MPRFSYIRYANIHYGNPVNNIDSMTINFHNGEHSLITGANGIGKSVLIQETMAPFMATRRQRTINDGKPFIDLLSKKHRTPQCVAIEYILDSDTEKYICIVFLAKRNENLRVDEETEKDTDGSIERVYFLRPYTRNQFHVDDIQIKNEEIHQYLTMDGVCENLEVLLKNRGVDYKGYRNLVDNPNERRSFFEMLEKHYGIYKNDWQIIMKSINKEEGGLAKMLDSKKSKSEKLVKAAFIETIIFNPIQQKISGSDRYLEQDFEDIKDESINLVEAARDNATYREKEVSMKKIQQRLCHEENMSDIQKLCSLNHDWQQEGKNIAIKKNNLINLKQGVSIQIKEDEHDCENLKIERSEVESFKLNSDYQQIKENVAKEEQKITDLKQKKETLNININNLQSQVSSMKIGNAKTRISDLEAECGIIRGKIQKIDQKNDISNSINEIGIYLHSYFTNQIQTKESKRDAIIKEIEAFNDEKKQSIETLKGLKQLKDKNNVEKGCLNERLDTLKKKEKSFLDSSIAHNLEFNFHKNMFDEYEPDKEGNTAIEFNIQFYAEKKGKTESEIKSLENTLLELSEKRKSIMDDLETTRKLCSEKQNEKSRLIQDRNSHIECPKKECTELIRDCMNITGTISDLDIERYKQTVLEELDVEIKNKSNLQFEIKNKITSKINEKKALLKPNKRFFDDPKFQEILQLLSNQGFDLQLGCDWLEEQTEEEALKAVSLNPLLPQSLISINQDELDKIKGILQNLAGSEVVHTDFNYPIILTTYESIKSTNEMKSYPKNHIFVTKNGHSYFYTAINPLLFNQEFKKAKICEIDELISRLQKEQEELIKVIQVLSNKKFVLNNNKYTLENDIESQRKISNVTQEIQKYSDIIVHKNKELERLDERIQKLSNDSKDTRKMLEHIEQVLETLVDYQSVYHKILQTNTNIVEIQNELQHNQNEINKQEKSIALCESKLSEYSIQKQDLNRSLNELENQRNSFLIFSISDTFQESQYATMNVFSVINEYETLRNTRAKYDDDLEMLHEKLNKISQQIAHEEKIIQQELIQCEQAITEENVSILKTPMTEIHKAEKEIENLVEKYNKLNGALGSHEAELEREKKKEEQQKDNILQQGYSILEPNKIIVYKEGYPNKIKTIESKIKKLTTQISKYKSVIHEIEHRILYIEREIGNIFGDTLYISDPIKVETVLDEAKMAYLFNDVKEALEVYQKTKELVNKAENRVGKYIDELISECSQLRGVETILGSLKDFKNTFINSKKSKNYEELVNYYEQIKYSTEDSILANDNSLKTYNERFDRCVNSLLKYYRVQHLQMTEIDKKSKVKIFEHVNSTKLFSINLPKFDNKKEEYRLKINHFLTSAIEIALESEDGMRNFKSLITPINLFKAVTPFEDIDIRISKISGGYEEIDMQRFEDSLKFSGGESTFVCCEILFPILYYVRDNDTFRRNHSSVLIIDNPFAQTSSLELIQPILKLANALNIQLIAFTHEEFNDNINELFPVLVKLQSMKISQNSDKNDVYVYAEENQLNEDALLTNKNVYQMDFARYEQGELF